MLRDKPEILKGGNLLADAISMLSGGDNAAQELSEGKYQSSWDEDCKLSLSELARFVSNDNTVANELNIPGILELQNGN